MSGMGFGGRLKSELLGTIEKIPVLGGVMRAANGAAGPFSVALVGAGVALGVLKKSIAEFAANQQGVAALDAALAQSGQLTDAYREKLQALAGQMQERTAIAGAEWLQVLLKLTQFGAKESNIGQYTTAVKNLAGVIGGDINSAAVLFAKAMQGNYDALKRYGISITKTGDLTKDLDRLMTQLAQRGSGILEARARSLSGQFKQLGLSMADFFSAIGRGTAQVNWRIPGKIPRRHRRILSRRGHA
jgi:hypothetical protein